VVGTEFQYVQQAFAAMHISGDGTLLLVQSGNSKRALTGGLAWRPKAGDNLMRMFACSVGICLLSLALTGDAESAAKSVTWTGWFSDASCASARASSGTFTATNPDCAKKCIEKGAAAVFISEQAQALFTVQGTDVLTDLGYHVEVQARVDDGAKTIEIQKVTRLDYAGAACSRPKKLNF
jgi:hypothetical protein